MCGIVDDIIGGIGDVFGGIGDFLGDNLGNLLSVASFIPGPWQPFTLGLNAMYNLANENPLGAALSAFGAAGGLGGLGNAAEAGSLAGAGGAPGASQLLNSVDDLSGAWGSIGQGSTSLGDMFSAAGTLGGNALGSLDGLSGSFAPVAGTAGSGLSVGAGSDALGEFLSTLPSDRFAPESGIQSSLSPAANTAGNVMDSIGLSGVVDSLAGMGAGGTNFAQGLQGAMGNSPLLQTLMGAGKLYGGYQDYRSAQDARRALAANNREIRNLYSVDSPYAQHARQVMERRDAAKGRTSQYGPRETQLAALLADKRANALLNPNYLGSLAASKQRGAGLGGLFGGGTQFLRGLGGLF